MIFSLPAFYPGSILKDFERKGPRKPHRNCPCPLYVASSATFTRWLALRPDTVLMVLFKAKIWKPFIGDIMRYYV